MDALVWGERFLTGLPLVDEQHEHLVTLVNAFGELQTSTAIVPLEKLEALVTELATYAHTHFVDEEALMRRAGVHARFATAHAAEHARFLRDVRQMQQARFFGAPETARALLSFLMNWLAFHILGTDMQLARQVQRIERGEPAEAAFAAEVRETDGPARLLLGALDQLLAVVSLRNTALTEANERLEARVAQRTAELEGSLATLRITQGRLVETQKLASVAQLASGMAHEINSPLGAVTSNVNVLFDYARSLLRVAELARQFAPQLPPPIQASLSQAWREGRLDPVNGELEPLVGDIREGLARVKTIVTDLKAFARVDATMVSEVELGNCVKAALKLVGAAQREGVTFTTDLQEAPRLRCVSAQVNQAVLALVLNAAQAVRDLPGGRGVVTIRTGDEGELAFVEVKDDGVGMPPEVLARAFEPFFTTRPPGKGVGLGLSSAYQCALAHGGRLEAMSEPHGGTTMRLLLSRSAPLETNETLAPTHTYTARRMVRDARVNDDLAAAQSDQPPTAGHAPAEGRHR